VACTTSCKGHSRRLSQVTCVAILSFILAGEACALTGPGHRHVTQTATEILRDADPDAWEALSQSRGNCLELPPLIGKSRPPLSQHWDQNLAEEAVLVDGYKDLEFVDVEGGFGSGGRDDPHREEADAFDDEAHYAEHGYNLTAFNHFIDIKKGTGLFDDFDGYSYKRGSARRAQYQRASDAASGYWATLIGKVARVKVDEGLMYWFSDEYVHAPCHSWYRGCSPSVERYSFPTRYQTVREELAARFPVAASIGRTRKGIPYSVFMPVDNIARYWYGRFVATRDPRALGPAMHAIQDASVPHHAAGYSGNWHERYEGDVESSIRSGEQDGSVEGEIKGLLLLWGGTDSSPPTSLRVSDYSKRPAMNWDVDQLVTWVALHAFRHYAETYDHFRQGYRFDADSAEDLRILSTAMSVHVLGKAAKEMEAGATATPEGAIR